jgi:hypothetical protein
MLSDQGRQYISCNFVEMLKSYGIKQKLTTPHNPTGNSISERFNQTISTVIRMSRRLPLSALANNIKRRLNLNVNRMTGKSPYELMFEKDVFGISTKPKVVNWEELKSKMLINIKKSEDKRNKKRNEWKLKIGDSILKLNHSPDKAEDIWQGPFEIVDVDCEGNWVVIDQGNKKSKQNVKNVRPFFGEGRMLCTNGPTNPSGLTPISGNPKVFKQTRCVTHAPHAEERHERNRK